MNIKNYLEVHVKIVPAGNLIYYYIIIISYLLRRFSPGVVKSSVLTTAGLAGILVASIVRELLGGLVVLG